MTKSTDTFVPKVEKLDMLETHYAEYGEVVSTSAGHRFRASFSEEVADITAGVGRVSRHMGRDPQQALIGALYKTLAAWKAPHFIGETCGILTTDIGPREIGESVPCLICDRAHCEAIVHYGEAVKGPSDWDTNLQPEVIVRVGPSDWRWFCFGEVGCARSFAAADIQVSLIADYGGPNTRRLDVLVDGKKEGELRWANGIYSYIPYYSSFPRWPVHPCLPQKARVSDRLFAVFADRIPSHKRADRAAMYQELGLAPDADDFSFLEASGGKLVTSAITLRKPA